MFRDRSDWLAGQRRPPGDDTIAWIAGRRRILRVPWRRKSVQCIHQRDRDAERPERRRIERADRPTNNEQAAEVGRMMIVQAKTSTKSQKELP